MSKRKIYSAAALLVMALLVIAVLVSKYCYIDCLYYSGGLGGLYTTDEGCTVHVYTGSKRFGFIADSVEVAGLIKIVAVTPERVSTKLFEDKSVRFFGEPNIVFVDSPGKLCSVEITYKYITKYGRQCFDIDKNGHIQKRKP